MKIECRLAAWLVAQRRRKRLSIISTMQDVLTTAIQWHRMGDLNTAARLYRQVLAQTPDNADALHLLGVVHHQRGEYAAAVELMSRAVALRPDMAEYYVNLAEAQRALGHGDRAVACCEMALRLHPDHFGALHNLGVALQSLGRHAEAVEPLRRAVQLQPDAAPILNSLGCALRQLGQSDEALTHFQRAAELAPNDAVAQSNLGQMLLNLNRAEAALAPCREAVRLRPGVPTLHLILGDALRCAGRFEEARAAYLQAIQLQPTLAQAHANLGLLYRTQRKIFEALVPLKRAVALEPNNASFWKYLAEVNADWTDFEEAIRCWQRAMALQPGQPTMHLGLSLALLESGRFAEAEEHVRSAMRIQPDSGAAQFGLASVHEQVGEKTQAEAAFRAAVGMQAALSPLVYDRLATLLRGRVPDADRIAIEEQLANPQLHDDSRIKLLFALTTVFDARGDYARAFECARQANALSLERTCRRGKEYGPEQHRRFVDETLQVFGPDFFRRTAGGGLATERPVFILGLPRSGTTLVEQILASHPCVHGAGELRLAAQSLLSIPGLLGRKAEPLACVPALDSSAIRRLSEQHLARLDALDGGRAERITDKMPQNYLHMGLLAALFPRGVFIHCRRDLRDVAVSCWLTHFSWLEWTNDLDHICTRFADYGRLMKHWRGVLPVTMHEVDYEDVVADLEGTSRRLVAACGLEWDPACLEFHRTRRPVRTASSAQVRTPIYQQSVGRWKHYEQEMADVFARLY